MIKIKPAQEPWTRRGQAVGSAWGKFLGTLRLVVSERATDWLLGQSLRVIAAGIRFYLRRTKVEYSLLIEQTLMLMEHPLLGDKEWLRAFERCLVRLEIADEITNEAN